MKNPAEKKSRQLPVTLPRISDDCPRFVVGMTDTGRICGEDNPSAKLFDHEVELVLELKAEGLSYREIAMKFGCSRELVAKICQGLRRYKKPVRVKKVR